jgi:hypothetical protein
MSFKKLKSDYDLPDNSAEMVKLWTFDTREKLDSFSEVLQRHEIAFETQSPKGNKDETNGVVIMVRGADFEEARRLMLRYRQSRSTNKKK